MSCESLKEDIEMAKKLWMKRLRGLLFAVTL